MVNLSLLPFASSAAPRLGETSVGRRIDEHREVPITSPTPVGIITS
jgi:hypothetical protein